MLAAVQATQDLGTLWTLTKDGHDARADVRGIDGIGFELRYAWDGELRVSEVFRGAFVRPKKGGGHERQMDEADFRRPTRQIHLL